MENTDSITQAKINDCVDSIKNFAQSTAEEIAWYAKHQPFLDDLGKIPYVSCYSITFYGLDHSQVVKCIRYFGGKYSKEYEDETVNYHRTKTIESRLVYLNGSQPPDSCKIVEEWADIPAQPATRKLIRKLQCKEPVLPDSSESQEDLAIPPTWPDVYAEDADGNIQIKTDSFVPQSVPPPNSDPTQETSPAVSIKPENSDVF